MKVANCKRVETQNYCFTSIWIDAYTYCWLAIGFNSNRKLAIINMVFISNFQQQFHPISTSSFLCFQPLSSIRIQLLWNCPFYVRWNKMPAWIESDIYKRSSIIIIIWNWPYIMALGFSDWITISNVWGAFSFALVTMDDRNEDRQSKAASIHSPKNENEIQLFAWLLDSTSTNSMEM